MLWYVLTKVRVSTYIYMFILGLPCAWEFCSPGICHCVKGWSNLDVAGEVWYPALQGSTQHCCHTSSCSVVSQTNGILIHSCVAFVA